MIRVDDRTVELTPDEQIIADEHDELLDDGFSIPEAVNLITGKHLPPKLEQTSYEIRSRLLRSVADIDAVLTPEFVEWLGH